MKLIAEPWDCGGLYLVGKFPNWDRWGEWNGIYRDDLRRFMKGDAGMKSAFATRVSGSADLYKTYHRKPYHGVNFITAHDGFSLMDLVSYNQKVRFGERDSWKRWKQWKLYKDPNKNLSL